MTDPRSRLPPPFVVRVLERAIQALGTLQNKLLPPEVVMMNASAGGIIVSRAIYIAAELGVADHLASGPLSTAELARLCQADPGALYRVLRALASIGVFAEQQDKRFALTPLADCLRSDAPGSIRAWIRSGGAPWAWDLWGPVMETMKNGRTVPENTFGRGFFPWLEDRPEVAAAFDAGMSSVSPMTDAPIVAAVDFARFGTIVDVGGGQGSLLAAILRRSPALRGVLFDRPAVIERARSAAFASDPSLGARLSLCAGDFFEAVPTGGDAYVLKWVLHDWEDADAIRLLASCRRAMTSGQHLFVAELLVEPGNNPSLAKLMDVVMLSLTGGRERTAAEYRALLEAASFRVHRVLGTASPYSVIEAVAV